MSVKKKPTKPYEPKQEAFPDSIFVIRDIAGDDPDFLEAYRDLDEIANYKDKTQKLAVACYRLDYTGTLKTTVDLIDTKDFDY